MTNKEGTLTPNNTTVGCIGLGIMGLPAARNLIKAGYRLIIWARRKESLAPLLAEGATAAESPAQLAQKCDAVVTNVSDTPDVEQVLLGGDGVIDGCKPGQIIMDMSTIAPAATIAMARKFAAKGAAMLDAPVSGGEKGAIAGTLTFMVGGDPDAFRRAAPLFAAMGKTVTHIGESGSGQVAKACNQIIIGATISGVGEALRLARAMGADVEKVRAALLGGFAGSRVLEIHGKRMIDGDYAPGFKAVLHEKDVRLALAAAAESGVRLPSAELFAARLQRLIAKGEGEKDSAAAATTLEEE